MTTKIIPTCGHKPTRVAIELFSATKTVGDPQAILCDECVQLYVDNDKCRALAARIGLERIADKFMFMPFDDFQATRGIAPYPEQEESPQQAYRELFAARAKETPQQQAVWGNFLSYKTTVGRVEEFLSNGRHVIAVLGDGCAGSVILNPGDTTTEAIIKDAIKLVKEVGMPLPIAETGFPRVALLAWHLSIPVLDMPILITTIDIAPKDIAPKPQDDGRGQWVTSRGKHT